MRREEEEQRAREVEELRLAEESRRAEEERLRQAMAEEQKRRELEEERLEAERQQVNAHSDSLLLLTRDHSPKMEVMTQGVCMLAACVGV